MNTAALLPACCCWHAGNHSRLHRNFLLIDGSDAEEPLFHTTRLHALAAVEPAFNGKTDMGSGKQRE